MKVAVIENGKVVNIVVANAVEDVSNGVADDGTAWIGADWDGSSFSPKPTTPKKTDAEKLAEAEEKLDTRISAARNLERALAMAIFDLANEVRDLKGQQPLTVEQFKTYIKGKLI